MEIFAGGDYVLKSDGKINSDAAVGNGCDDMSANSTGQFAQAYMMENTENQIKRFSYEFECLILHGIRDGNLATIQATRTMLLDAASRLSSGKVAHCPIKQHEYLACTFIALATRAAIEGGVDVLNAYALSDVLLQRLAKATCISAIDEIIRDVRISFLNLVKEANMVINASFYVKKAKSYVKGNLNRHFKLEDVAAHVGLSKQYLSKLFSASEGMGIMDCARLKRVEAAAEMLRNTGKSIPEIAAYLCFPSQSYFGAVFKKIKGVTPHHYRISNRLVDI